VRGNVRSVTSLLIAIACVGAAVYKATRSGWLTVATVIFCYFLFGTAVLLLVEVEKVGEKITALEGEGVESENSILQATVHRRTYRPES
jgi:uncharacterized membrane protein